MGWGNILLLVVVFLFFLFFFLFLSFFFFFKNIHNLKRSGNKDSSGKKKVLSSVPFIFAGSFFTVPLQKKNYTESKEGGLKKPFTHACYKSVEKHTWKNQSLFSPLPQVKRHLFCQHHLITEWKWFLTLPSIKHIRQQRKGTMVQERQGDWVPHLYDTFL